MNKYQQFRGENPVFLYKSYSIKENDDKIDLKFLILQNFTRNGVSLILKKLKLKTILPLKGLFFRLEWWRL